MTRIAFPYDGFGDMVIPDENLLAVLAPRTALNGLAHGEGVRMQARGQG